MMMTWDCKSQNKNDNYVKEAPAYYRSFLDSFHKKKGRGKGFQKTRYFIIPGDPQKSTPFLDVYILDPLYH